MYLLRRKKSKTFHYPDLAGWLDIAILDLEHPARQRISSEIQSHYTESVAAHLTNGQTEILAHSSALAELGDPIAAARQFQKTHLTEDESGRLRWAQEKSARPFFSPGIAWLDYSALALLALFLFLSRGRFIGPFNLAVFPGSLFFHYFLSRAIPRILSSRLGQTISIRKVIALCACLHDFLRPIFVGLFLYPLLPQACILASFLGMATVNSYKTYLIARTWNKLRKLDDTQAG